MTRALRESQGGRGGSVNPGGYAIPEEKGGVSVGVIFGHDESVEDLNHRRGRVKVGDQTEELHTVLIPECTFFFFFFCFLVLYRMAAF